MVLGIPDVVTDSGLQEHEWTPDAGDDSGDGAADDEDDEAVKDSMGSVLVNGDSVVTIRDLIADGKAVRAVRAHGKATSNKRKGGKAV